MRDRPTKEKQLPAEIPPEPTPVYVRSHTRVKDEKPRKDGEGKLADKWANYALVFDCETTTDIRISVLDNLGPIQYHARKTANTRPADAALIIRAKRFSKKLLRRKSGASQHAVDRFFLGEPIHLATRKKLDAVAKLEREKIE